MVGELLRKVKATGLILDCQGHLRETMKHPPPNAKAIYSRAIDSIFLIQVVCSYRYLVTVAKLVGAQIISLTAYIPIARAPQASCLGILSVLLDWQPNSNSVE